MERELCLQIPPKNLSGVAAAISTQKAKQVQLRALYFDTPTRALAQAGIALRVRREGRKWVQTLKAPGTDALSRVELNHPRDTNTLDLSLYEGSPLEQFFATLDEPLQLRFETDVQRHVLLVEQNNTQIEIAFDQGVIRAQDWSLPIREVEFELVSGVMDDLFSLAEQWLVEHSLILEVRSKAHRGDILARLSPAPTTDALPPAKVFEARRAKPVALTPDLTPEQAYLLCANECMQQIMTNAALLATATPKTLDADTQALYVHQLRVGVRRMRSCWNLFKGLVPKARPEIEQGLKHYFRLLGKTRCDDVMRLHIEPMLAQAGMPENNGQATETKVSPSTPAGEADHIVFQSALLALLQQLIKLGDDHQARLTKKKTKGKKSQSATNKAKDLTKPLQKRLRKWWGKILDQGQAFSELSVDERHDLRKQVKRLRYCLEFSSGLVQTKKLKALSVALEDLQDILGDLNDFYVAEAHYRQHKPNKAAWFAIGWLRAMQAVQLKKAQAFFDQHDAQA